MGQTTFANSGGITHSMRVTLFLAGAENYSGRSRAITAVFILQLAAQAQVDIDADNNRLFARGVMDGFAPGEGAGFLLLCSEGKRASLAEKPEVRVHTPGRLCRQHWCGCGPRADCPGQHRFIARMPEWPILECTSTD